MQDTLRLSWVLILEKTWWIDDWGLHVGAAICCMNHLIRHQKAVYLLVKCCTTVYLSPTHSPIMAIDIERSSMVQEDPTSLWNCTWQQSYFTHQSCAVASTKACFLRFEPLLAAKTTLFKALCQLSSWLQVIGTLKLSTHCLRHPKFPQYPDIFWPCLAKQCHVLGISWMVAIIGASELCSC